MIKLCSAVGVVCPNSIDQYITLITEHAITSGIESCFNAVCCYCDMGTSNKTECATSDVYLKFGTLIKKNVSLNFCCLSISNLGLPLLSGCVNTTPPISTSSSISDDNDSRSDATRKILIIGLPCLATVIIVVILILLFQRFVKKLPTERVVDNILAGMSLSFENPLFDEPGGYVTSAIPPTDYTDVSFEAIEPRGPRTTDILASGYHTARHSACSDDQVDHVNIESLGFASPFTSLNTVVENAGYTASDARDRFRNVSTRYSEGCDSSFA